MNKPWIQHLLCAVDDARDLPLFGNPPPFNAQKFLTVFKELSGIENLELEVKPIGFLPYRDVLTRDKASFSITPIRLTPIKSPLFLILENLQVENLLSLTITTDGGELFSDVELRKGFYRFLIGQALLSLNKAGIYPSLSSCFSEGALPEEDLFVVDIHLSKNNASTWLKLAIPKDFQTEFKSFFSSSTRSIKEIAGFESTPIEVSYSLGNLSLSIAQLRTLNIGDFIILDECYYNPISKKGHMQMLIGETPLLYIKQKEDHLKVLDYVYTGNKMDEDNFDLDEELPIEDAFNGDLGEDSLDENVEEEMAEEEEISPREEIEQPSLVHPADVPLKVTIEMGRLSLSLQKLSELTPGSVIETSLPAYQTVSLSLNGKIIGRGELIQLGEMLGVKITDLGK